MVQNADYYIDLDSTIINGDKDRDSDFRKYDKMSHCAWELPEGLPSWVRRRTSSDPDNSITTSTQVLSALDPLIQVLPLASDIFNKDRANMIEQSLLWQFYSASRRRASPIIEDLVRSALVYDAIAAQVIDLDYQIKSERAAKKDTKRTERMRKVSRFLVNVYNPAFVHARTSDYGVECVVTKQTKSAYQIWKEFGAQAPDKIVELATDKDKDNQLNLYEHWDDEVRMVYVLSDTEHPIGGKSNHDPIIIVKPYEHDLGFSNWVIRFGSNTMEYETRYKYHPMLANVLRSDEWEYFNLADSLMVSKAVATAGKPDIVEEGEVSKSTTKIDYDEPTTIAKVTPGNRLKELQPGQLDPRLFEVRNELRIRMTNSTVANLLRSGETQAGEAYAALNLRVLTALGALKPFKRKAEYAVEDICSIIMHWVEKSGEPLISYQRNPKHKDYGKFYKIEPDEIDAESLIFKVELKADLPIDQLQRIHAANQAVAGMGLSKERGLEMIGVGDASQAIQEGYLEKLQEFEFAKYQQEQLAMMQMEIQNMQAKAQMAMQQAQAAAKPQGVPGAEGMNPAEGGLPAAMANPGATRENQTGQTMSGEGQAPTAGGGLMV